MSSTIKIKAPAMPEPDGPWHWKNIRTGKSGLYEEDPRKFGIDIEHPDYQWKHLPSEAQLAARDAQWQESAGVLAKALTGILERYVRLVESGDAGVWDCETEPEVIAARAALSAITEN